jgi:hypothetical protein
MKKEQFLLVVFLVIILSALVLRLMPREKYALRVPKVNTPPSSETVAISEVVKESEIASSSELTLPEISTSSEVIINKPIAGELIKSPLIVEGQAPGNWFFEATLPVKLIAANGDIILASYGKAQSDWMTTSSVAFKSISEFNTTATSGYLVISKDNPSGLPEYDASITIPVLFK